MKQKNKKSSIKTNFMYQMLYEILILILPFITSPYIARTIGAEGLGIYSYSYSVANYFVIFSMLGLKNYGNRKIAQVRNDKQQLNEEFSNLLFLHLLISFIVFILYIVYVILFTHNDIYAFIQTMLVLSSIIDISWFYFGMEKFKLTVSRNIIIKILNVIFVFVFVKDKNDLWIYCLIMALGILISQLFLWIPLHNYVKIRKPNWKSMKNHIGPLFILFIPTIAVSFYKYMDKIMIGIMSCKLQLGYYENAEKLVSIPITIVAAFGTVMLPKMSNLMLSGTKKEIDSYIFKSVKYVMCLAFALSFGIMGIGTVFAPIFWGSEFYQSGLIIMGLSLTVPFVSFANVLRTEYLIPKEKDKEYMTSVIMGAIVNLITNAIFIPKYGAIGAMIGTIFAEFTVCTMQTVLIRKELDVILYIKNSSVFAVIGLFMFFIVYGLGRIMNGGIVTLIIQILVGGIFYLASCCVIFYKQKDTLIMSLLEKLNIKKLTK